MATVSVIIPVHGEGKLLLDAVESVRKSTYHDVEIIISDDGSADKETLSVLNALKKKAGLQVLRHPNQGVSAARNAGVAASAGRYLMMLDADDRIGPEYIEKAVAILESQPDTAVCYAKARFFGIREDEWLLPPFSVEQMLEDNVVFVTSLMRREVFLSVGGFDSDFQAGYEDYNFYLSCVERGYQFYRIPEELFFYRIREKSRNTEVMRDANKLISSRIMLYEKHRSLFEANGIDCSTYVGTAVKNFSEHNSAMLAAANAKTESVKRELENAVTQWTNSDYLFQKANARAESLDGQVSQLTAHLASDNQSLNELQALQQKVDQAQQALEGSLVYITQENDAHTQQLMHSIQQAADNGLQSVQQKVDQAQQALEGSLVYIAQENDAHSQQLEHSIQQATSSSMQAMEQKFVTIDACVQSLNEQLKAKVQLLSQQLETKNQQLSEKLEAMDKQLSEQLNAKNKQMNTMERLLTKQVDALVHCQQQVDEYQNKLQQSEETLAVLQAQLGESQAQCEAISQEKDQLQHAHDYVVSQWSSSASTIATLQATLTDRQNRINLMSNSISWKLTRPLRGVKWVCKKTAAKSVLGVVSVAKKLRKPHAASSSVTTAKRSQWPPVVAEKVDPALATALPDEKHVRRLVVFNFFDADQQADDYVVYLLRAIKTHAKRLLVVVNGDLQEESIQRLKSIGAEVMIRENTGLDAWAEREGLMHIGLDELESYDEVLIANGTIMGPVRPLAEMFEEMNQRKLDFWGLVAHRGMDFDSFGCNPYGRIPEHLQSFFFAFRQRLVKSKVFKEFWKKFPTISNYNESVGLYETVLTQYFADHGFVWNSYMDAEQYYLLSENPLIDIPVESIKQFKSPFFKRRTFFQDYDYYTTFTGQHTALQLLNYLQDETDYPIKYIMKNLIRTTHMCDLTQDLHLSKILDASQCFGKKRKTLFSSLRAALFAHLYDVSMLPTMVEYMSNLPAQMDIYISTTSEEKAETIRAAYAALPNRCTVKVCPNRGRDVSALLTVFKPFVSKYDVICVTHDKKTGYLKPGTVGEGFAYQGYENLMASEEYVINVLNAFLEDPFLGMLYTPDPNHADFGTHIGLEWGENFAATKRLHEELGLHAPISESKPPCAPFGSNFWIRTKALAPLYQKNWTYDDFPAEPFKMVDGSILHAVERIYPYCAQHAGYYSALLMTTDYAAIELGNLQFDAQQYAHVAFDHGVANRFITVRDIVDQRLSESDSIGTQAVGNAAPIGRNGFVRKVKRRTRTFAVRVVRKMEQWNKEVRG